MEAKYILTRAGDICEVIQNYHGMIQYETDSMSEAMVKHGNIVIDSNISMNLHRNKESQYDIIEILSKETHPELYL